MSRPGESKPFSGNAQSHDHASKDAAQAANGNDSRQYDSSTGMIKSSHKGRPEIQSDVPSSGKKRRIRKAAKPTGSPSFASHSPKVPTRKVASPHSQSGVHSFSPKIQETTPDSPRDKSLSSTIQNELDVARSRPNKTVLQEKKPPSTKKVGSEATKEKKQSPLAVSPSTMEESPSANKVQTTVADMHDRPITAARTVKASTFSGGSNLKTALSSEKRDATGLFTASPAPTVKRKPAHLTRPAAAAKDDVTKTKSATKDPSTPEPQRMPTMAKTSSSPLAKSIASYESKKRERDREMKQVMPDAKRMRNPDHKSPAAPKLHALSAEECDLLVSAETLSDDMERKEEVDAAMNPVGGFAKLPEDSLAMRHESWRKLRDLNNVNNENGEKRSAVAKAAKLALQKASAAYSASLATAPVQTQRSPQATSYCEFSSRRAHSKPPMIRVPPVLPVGRVPVPHRTVHMAFPGGIPLPPSRPGPAFLVPRGGRPFKITKEQVRDAIPENASCVFHIMDRRVNLDSFAPDASFYSLLRAWTLDDPYRQIPPTGSNILELVPLPSDKRVPLKRPNVVSPKKIRRDVTGTVNVLSKVKAQELSSMPSVDSLRVELVEKSWQLKQEKRKEDVAWMEASRASLRRLGIDFLSKPT